MRLRFGGAALAAAAMLMSGGCLQMPGGADSGPGGSGGDGGGSASGGNGGDGGASASGGGSGTGGNSGSGGASGAGGGGALCGNETVDAGEACDGANLNGQTCDSLGAHFGGTPVCDTCQFDTSGCFFVPCGNQVKDLAEQCDGSDVGNATCEEQGMTGGAVVTCHPDCTMDFSACGGTGWICSNGVREGFEQCDSGDLGPATCADFGYTSGLIGCTSTCLYDSSGCFGGGPPGCGNERIDSGEACDGSLFDTSCASEGFFGGPLGCTAACTLDTSRCFDSSAPLAQLVMALCSIDDCSAEWGRMFESEELCLQLYTGLIGSVFSQVDEAAVLACANAISDAVAGCTGGAFPTEVPECENLSQDRPFDAECSSDSQCADPNRCIDVPTQGERCSRCLAAAQLTDSCAGEAECDATLVCGGATTCEALAGYPCAFDYQCGDYYDNGYYCDLAAGSCQERSVGAPCYDTDPEFDQCRGTDPTLVCVAGACAAPVPYNFPCDDNADCENTQLACIGGTCQDAHERDEACSNLHDCKGNLVCDAGFCRDRPIAGQPCVEDCLLPSTCISGICAAYGGPETPPGVGGTCANPDCGYQCYQLYGYCQDSYCDDDDSAVPPAPTFQCQSFAALGAECPDFEECDPRVAECQNDGAGVYRCTAKAGVGQSCSSVSCVPGAYCDALEICRVEGGLGDACGEYDQCHSRRCYGTCSDTLLPCSGSYDCASNVCNGTCIDPRAEVSYCGP